MAVRRKKLPGPACFFSRKSRKALISFKKNPNIRLGKILRRNGERFAIFCVCTGRQKKPKLAESKNFLKIFQKTGAKMRLAWQ